MKKAIIKLSLSILIFIIGCVIKVSWIKIILFLISYLIAGYKVLLETIKNIKEKELFSEEFLMSIATLGAFTIGEYPEAVSVMILFKIGEIFEEYAENKSKKSIESLMSIKPDYANLKQSESIVKKSPTEIHIGEIIIVKPGEKIPLDGIVINGEAMIDTSNLTGETVPRRICAGEEILSGSINTNGLLEIKVTREFEESTVSKILNLIKNASEKKAQTENFITKFAKVYTPIVVILALLIILIPIIAFKQEIIPWVYRALTFLVISCPCALVISVPLSFFGGIGGASKRGILVKGSNYLELLSKVDTIVFDKTGTLTKGVFKVQKIEPIDKEKNLIEIAAMLEVYSNHPIANSIKEKYGKEVDRTRITEFEEISGLGVKARIDGIEFYIGNSKLMNKIDVKTAKEEVGTVVYIAEGRKYIGKIVISDEIKLDSKETIKALKNQGIRETYMLTGDKKTVGENVAQSLEIDEVYSELLPADKVEKLAEIIEIKKKNVAFVGDGLNDAPVLAMADVGIAMGAYGTEAAIEAADIVIMNDEPSKIPIAIKIARKTMRIAKENIIFAMAIKIMILVLGFCGIATMWEAVFADVGVTVIAVLNALRMLKG